jgi:Holliday junction resolvasome RuvABC endonuclease subunit
MEKYIYALDLSLNSSGVCIFKDDGKFVKSTTIDTNSLKETKLKLKKIGNEFIDLMKQYPPKVVVIEQGFVLFNTSTQQLFRVHGLVNYLFSEYEQIYYPATIIKKTFTGKGNSNKEVVREKVKDLYPELQFASLDETDAFSIGETYFIKQGIKNGPENI